MICCIRLSSQDEVAKLYEACMALVQTYGKCNLGKCHAEIFVTITHLSPLVREKMSACSEGAVMNNWEKFHRECRINSIQSLLG